MVQFLIYGFLILVDAYATDVWVFWFSNNTHKEFLSNVFYYLWFSLFNLDFFFLFRSELIGLLGVPNCYI